MSDASDRTKYESGFAAIENDLYYGTNTLMLFGDAKQVTGDVVKQLTGEGTDH
jgi:H+-translocating NAD(P) transhydrogenase subunit beta